MPSALEKQRILYTDPHANNQRLLMNDRRNDPLNFSDMKASLNTMRESPAKTANTFYD